MPMRYTDPLHGTSRGSPEEVKRHIRDSAPVKRRADVFAYIDEVYRLCALTDLPGGPLDASILIAQSDLETGRWGAIPQPGMPPYWERDLNPAGIGIWQDGVPSPFTISTGRQAGQIHVYEMLIHLHGRLRHRELEEIADIDAEHAAKVFHLHETVGYPPMRRIDDLNIRFGPNGRECTWACDQAYEGKLVERGRWLFPTLADTEGLLKPKYKWDPIPFSFTRMIVPKPPGVGYSPVSPRQTVGLCRHATDGPDRGTALGIFKWFRGDYGGNGINSLTDWVVGPGGEIVMLNDPRGTRAPVANGGSGGLRGNGPAFVSTFGAVINSRLHSIEHCATREQHLLDPQFHATVRLQAAIHQECQMPWDSYPRHPRYGCVTDLEHWEFQREKDCPFKLKDQTDAMRAAVRGILHAAQTEASALRPDATELPTPIEESPTGSVESGPVYPRGLNEKAAREKFGTLVQYNPDGVENHIEFDPADFIANAWLARGAREHEFPAAKQWFRLSGDPNTPETIQDAVFFANGWVIVRGDPIAGWRWLDDQDSLRGAISDLVR